MIFNHLNKYSHFSGHYIEIGLKAPFIKRKDGTSFEDWGDPERLKIMDREGSFPFRELKHDGRTYFISDDDLLGFLTLRESETDNTYYTQNCPGWNFELKERFAECFFKGYDQGLNDFNQNLGVSYISLPYELKLPYLRKFCLFSLDFLYFEGFLDDDLFYNLGYLQANFYRGFMEINVLTSLSPDENNFIYKRFYRPVVEGQKSQAKQSDTENQVASNTTQPSNEPQTPEPENTTPQRIEILCDLQEVKKIWLVLTSPIKTSKGTEEAVFSKSELDQYLGVMFSSKAFPQELKQASSLPLKRTSKGDMRNVLIALMYSTFNLNRNYNRHANLINYAAMLHQYFTVFSTSEAESTKSVMATYAPKGFYVLKENLAENPHIKEMLSILKSHKLLH
jgi:hypothetical protein